MTSEHVIDFKAAFFGFFDAADFHADLDKFLGSGGRKVHPEDTFSGFF
jgi:hypothetical protein